MIIRKSHIKIVASIVLVAGVVGLSVAILNTTDTENKPSDSGLKKAAKDTQVANNPNAAPQGGSGNFENANQDSKGQTCRDISRTEVASVIGEVSSVRQEPVGNGPLNIVACIYTSTNTSAKIIVYGFSSTELARQNQEYFRSENLKIAILNKYVLALSVQKEGKYDSVLTDKLLTKVKPGIK